MASQILPTLSALFFSSVVPAPQLYVDDLFLVKYDAMSLDGQPTLAPHRDGSLLSFSVALNDPMTAFNGGGTHFVGVNHVVRPKCVGDLVAHCGKLLHGGALVTAGKRFILVGFVKATGPAVNKEFLESITVSRAFEDPKLDRSILRNALRPIANQNDKGTAAWLQYIAA